MSQIIMICVLSYDINDHQSTMPMTVRANELMEIKSTCVDLDEDQPTDVDAVTHISTVFSQGFVD